VFLHVCLVIVVQLRSYICETECDTVSKIKPQQPSTFGYLSHLPRPDFYGRHNCLDQLVRSRLSDLAPFALVGLAPAPDPSTDYSRAGSGTEDTQHTTRIGDLALEILAFNGALKDGGVAGSIDLAIDVSGEEGEMDG